MLKRSGYSIAALRGCVLTPELCNPIEWQITLRNIIDFSL
ncbi:hypothetical protein CRENPOLYSF1_330011 [Crenothrix polyspora]|uniref:Uncharacterized protein n=1 Tax=Crenothrix polyspora TaxID=360316 RepID=A0A1R4H907_9GAMM|nr:hypothetical protein CRENPOLYSF1_330011 [Crenothrix polyspora]